MASVVLQPNGKWKAFVRKKGRKTETRTFTLKAEADAWGAARELALESGTTSSFSDLRRTLVADVLKKFQDEEGPKRKGWKWEDNRIEAYLREPWANLNLTQDIPGALRAWRDERLKAVKGQTVNRDFNLLGGIFTHAAKEWGLKIENPVHQVKRPETEGGERDVVWTEADLQLFLDHFQFDPAVAPKTSTSFVPWVLLLARHTGLRLGNVHDILLQRVAIGGDPAKGFYPWLDLSVPCIHYSKEFTKSAIDYDCPLNRRAVELLKALSGHRRGCLRLIEPDKGTLGTLYRNHRALIAKQHPHVRGLNIHDLRHTWTTEAVPIIKAKGADDLTLAKITGRRSTKSLFRYFNPKAKELASLLD